MSTVSMQLNGNGLLFQMTQPTSRALLVVRCYGGKQSRTSYMLQHMV